MNTQIPVTLAVPSGLSLPSPCCLGIHLLLLPVLHIRDGDMTRNALCLGSPVVTSTDTFDFSVQGQMRLEQGKGKGKAKGRMLIPPPQFHPWGVR